MEENHFKSQFLLRKDITYLNFGSFGACPKPVFEDYQKWQLELEAEPVQYMTVNGLQYLRQSREALAKYIHCNAEDVVYVTNPSYGINIIAKSLKLNAGDEVLIYLITPTVKILKRPFVIKFSVLQISPCLSK